MTFWDYHNIDIWLLGGVVISLLWAIYKAIQYDSERLFERVRELEDNNISIYNKLRHIKSKLKLKHNEGK